MNGINGAIKRPISYIERRNHFLAAITQFAIYEFRLQTNRPKRCVANWDLWIARYELIFKSNLNGTATAVSQKTLC